jgi:hypothetical protein
MSLDLISTYFITFIKNDNTKNIIGEYIAPEFDKSQGQLAFKISVQQASDIRTYTNKYFYITGKNQNGLETVLFKGLFEI